MTDFYAITNIENDDYCNFNTATVNNKDGDYADIEWSDDCCNLLAVLKKFSASLMAFDTIIVAMDTYEMVFMLCLN